MKIQLTPSCFFSELVAADEKAGSGLAAEATVEQRRRAMKNRALDTLAISVLVVLKKGVFKAWYYLRPKKISLVLDAKKRE